MPNNKKDFRLLIKAISTPGKLEKEETGVNIILTQNCLPDQKDRHKLFNPSLSMTCTELKFLAVIQSWTTSSLYTKNKIYNI